MNLIDLVTKGIDVTVAVSLDDLKKFHDLILQDAKHELEHTIMEQKAESYLSPEKVCEMLDVNRSTLWRWDKKGYLTTIEVGGKRRYLLSDIKRLLNGGRTEK